MKKIWRAIAVWGLAACLGGGLLYTSQSVQKANDALTRLERENEAQTDSISVLSAEWEYLNSPQRLEALAREHYNMDLPEQEKVVDEDTLSVLPVEEEFNGIEPAAFEAGGGQ